VEPRAGKNVMEKRIFCLYWESNPGSSVVQPNAAHLSNVVYVPSGPCSMESVVACLMKREQHSNEEVTSLWSVLYGGLLEQS
jgi:hypothetical protein